MLYRLSMYCVLPAKLGNEAVAVCQQDVSDICFNQRHISYTIKRLDGGGKIRVEISTPALYQVINSAIAVRGMEMLLQWKSF